MNKYWKNLQTQYPVLKRLERKSKIFTLPGFDGVPVYDVYKFFIAEIQENSLPTRSKSIAFSFFLAIFPTLTFIFSLIPYLPYFRDMDTNILKLLQKVLPNEETYNFIKAFIQPLLQDLAKHKRGGLLTGSIFLVLFLMSNGVLAMMQSFDKKNHDHYRKRTTLQSRAVALKITFLLMLLFLFSLSLIVVGEELISLLSSLLNIQSKLTHTLLDILRFTLLIGMSFLGTSLIYYYGPATKTKYKFISTGATVATFLSLVVSIFYSYWVSNFNKLNLIFGSIGTIMLLMIWLNINAFVLIIGYEINASIHINKTNRQKKLEKQAVEN